tara:strand:+ start:920 stop:2053 length:1134 start_codon:yes stop_codon:yes gene_type:complete
MLTNEQAKCMDGTLSGYYYEHATESTDSLKWVIYLNGGGECDSQEGCYSHLESELGSSNYFESNFSDSSSWYFASGYCPYNPSFCSWNHVNVPYCSQDLHSGTRQKPTKDTWGLYFSGHLILAAILDDLEENYDLDKATEIILTGVSAGGLGTYMNVDYIKSRYPNAQVTAATIAGYYFYATFYNGTNYTNAEEQIADFRQDGIMNMYNLYQAYVDESCKEAAIMMMSSSSSNLYHPSACMMANYSLPYIESNIFAVQSQTDKVVLTGHDCFPDEYKMESEEQDFMKIWYQNMSIALQPVLEKSSQSSLNIKTGAFAAACYIHGEFSHTQPLINGINYLEAFSNFYFDESMDGTEESSYKLADDCGVMCNPTCPPLE